MLTTLSDVGVQGTHVFRSRLNQLPFLAIICSVMLFIMYRTTKLQYRHTQIEAELLPFDTVKDLTSLELRSLPRGIIHSRTDFELNSLWSQLRAEVVCEALSSSRYNLHL